MKTLIDNFSHTFPNCAPSFYKKSIEIEEPLNKVNGKFYKLIINGINAYCFDHNFAQQTSSFATLAGHNGILLKDCDGIFICEYNNQKYIVLCELKSAFEIEAICKANNQLIGSYVKLRSIFHILQGFTEIDYKILGVIVSYAPTSEQLTNMSKCINNLQNNFCIRLHNTGRVQQSAHNCQQLFHPLDIPGLEVKYISVPNSNIVHTIDFTDLL